MIRLSRLDLEMFGHFTGKSFDFGPRPDGSDFHVIHGPNEAGKTTTMEGWLRLLYGFEAREPYGFRHERKNLIVSGLLEIDGTPRLLRRLPLRKNALVDEHGTAQSEAALAAHLGGLSADQYRDLLCLDDATIERGGEEIVHSKGDIGRLLFSAAAGIGDLTPVLDRVRQEAEALYRKNSGKTRFAELRKALKETEARITAQDVSARDFKRLRDDLRRAQEAEAQITADRQAVHRAEARVAARIDALPLLARIDGLDADLAALAHLPADPGIDPDQVQALSRAQIAAETEAARLTTELARLKGDHDALHVDPEHLAPAEDLASLEPLRQRVRSAAPDLDRRRGELAETEAEMARLASALCPVPVTDAQGFVVSSPDLATLEAAREALKRAEGEEASEQSEIARLRERLRAAEDQVQQQQADAPEGPDLTEMLAELPLERLALQHEAAEQARRRHADAAAAALEALALPGQTFDSPPDMRLTVEEAEDHLHRLRQVQDRLDQTREAIAALDTRQAKLTARNAALTGAGALAGDAEAEAARAERDRLWQAHLADLRETSARAFEAAMATHDRIAEARLSHADRLADLRQGERQVAETDAERQALTRRCAALEAEWSALTETLETAQRDAGLHAPLAASALPGWLRKLDTARNAKSAQARDAAQGAALQERIRRVAETLRPLPGSGTDDFQHLAQQAAKHRDRWMAHRDGCRAAERRRDDLARDLQARQARLTDLSARLTEARNRWQAALSAALPDTVAGDRLLASLSPLNTLRELDQKRRDLDRQVTGMTRDKASLARAMETLSPGEDTAESRFDALHALCRQAQDTQKEKQALARRLEATQGALDAARRTLAENATALTRLATHFPQGPKIATLDDLQQAVSACRTVSELRDRHRELSDRICTGLGTATLDKARAALAGLTLSDLEAERSARAADRERIETAYRDAIATRSTAQTALTRISGDADIAELVERRALQEMELAEVALAHLRRTLGHRMAEEALRRYRDTHRSAMLQATESAFAALTNNAYRKLQTRQDGSSETLVALDAEGVAKQASDLSKGTRFQLYLALRAAAYEQLAGQGVCLPFFCDDIFETFDEERTRAACAVMRRIGRTGQAIYLTHHRHVVEIARETCGDAVRIHSL